MQSKKTKIISIVLSMCIMFSFLSVATLMNPTADGRLTFFYCKDNAQTKEVADGVSFTGNHSALSFYEQEEGWVVTFGQEQFAVGETITLTASVPAGEYSVGIIERAFNNRGAVQVSVNGENLGSVIDLKDESLTSNAKTQTKVVDEFVTFAEDDEEAKFTLTSVTAGPVYLLGIVLVPVEGGTTGSTTVPPTSKTLNTTDPIVEWKADSHYVTGGVTATFNDGSVTINSGSSSSEAFGDVMYSLTKTKYAVGADGFKLKIKVTSSSIGSMDAVMKLFGTAGDNAYTCTIKDILKNDGNEVEVKFPISGFKLSGSTPLEQSDIAKINKIEVDVQSPYWQKFTNLEATFGKVYAYVDGGNQPTTQDSTTEAPTTPVPTTEAPKTDAPTTLAPTEAPTDAIAPTTSPVVENKEAKPAKVKGVKVKAGKKKVTVTWKKAKNAKKYTVKYSLKKNMKKAKFKTVRKTKLVIKKLKSGKKVYVQVQGINGKTKGAFSKKVSKKVK